MTKTFTTGACAFMLGLSGLAQAAGLQANFAREAAPQIFAGGFKGASPFATILSNRPLTPVRQAALQAAISKVTYHVDAQGQASRVEENLCGGQFSINVYDIRQSSDSSGAKFRGGECEANFKKTGTSHLFVAALEAILPGKVFGEGHGDMKELITYVGFSDFEKIYSSASTAFSANSADGYIDFDFNLFDATVGPAEGDESVRVQMLLTDGVLGR